MNSEARGDTAGPPEQGRRRQARLHRVRGLVAAGVVALAGLSAFAASSPLWAAGVFTAASAEGPAQTVFAPAKPGPAIVVLSGQTGPENYKEYATELASLGYYTVLLDGKDILNKEQTGGDNLRKALSRAQAASQVVKGKAAVIGFSLGGGAALAYATSMNQQVSMVLVHYPFTNFTSAQNADSFVKRFRVPVLILAGERDHYNNCCLIESMRAIEAAAKKSGATFELVVYPQADHGFNLPAGKTYRQTDDRDAMRRATAMLQQYHPLPATP
jgi:dienelactone hydrolase